MTVLDAAGNPVHVATGSPVCRGDRLATESDGQVAICFDDGTAFNLASDSSIELAQFEFAPDASLNSAQVKVMRGRFAFIAGQTATRGGFSIDTPFALTQGHARAGMLGTLTAAALMVALLREVEAAGNQPFLVDDNITYKDLKHGTLLIAPKGGATRGIVLDDPETTVVVGPPESGFLVQQILNSAADMAALLAASESVNLTYLLGLADPFTTGSIDRAETHLFFPNLPNIQLVSAPLNLLPPLGDDPPNQLPDFTTGGDNNPPPGQLTLVFDIDDTFSLKHNETAGVQVGSNDTADPFPFDLSGIPLIGRAQAGTPAAPFVDTTGSQLGSGTLTIVLEASSPGVPSGLQVTGGDLIFLFTETIAGNQVVVGREGQSGAPDPAGEIAFVIYVTPDGRTLWVQESLPIDHSDNDLEFIDSSALQLRLTLTDGATMITQTAPIGEFVGFEDDGPDALDDDPQSVAEDAVGSIGGNVINPEAADDPDASGKDVPGTDGAKLTHIDIGSGFVAITSGLDLGGGVYEHSNDFGTYTFHEDGSWTFDPEPNQANPVDASFFYRLTDGDGDTDEAKQTITVVDGSGPSSEDKLTLTLQESDLDTDQTGDDDAGDLAPGATTGSTPNGLGETDSGTLSFTAGSDDLSSFIFGSTAGIVVQGLLGAPVITWSGAGTDTITGQIDGVDAIILKLTGATIEAGDTGNVSVTATLLDAFPHALAGTDSISIDGILVNAAEIDGNFATAEVCVRVDDDVPAALDDSAEVQAQSAPATVNALVVLDKSGSMGSAGDPGSRISLAKAAILDLASQPNVLSIRILPFDSPADAPSIWFDLTQPGALAALTTFLNSITGNGNTNYEDAIYQAQQTWTAPPNDADIDNIYFISDGAATVRSNNGINDGNAGGMGSSSGLTSQEKAAWETFLAANGIENVYAVAIGAGVNNVDLQEIAYPNAPSEANNVIAIDSVDDLSATLTATTLTGTVSGNVINNLTVDPADDDNFGADGPGYIKTLRYDSDGDGALENSDNLYSFDGTNIYLNNVLVAANASEITFTTGFGGSVTFNFLTGAWSYSTPHAFSAQFIEHLSYTLADGDGDESEAAALDITVLLPPPTYMLTGAPDVVEGDPLIFALTLSHASAEDIVFRLATVDGTATGGSDFETSGFRYSVDGGTTWIDAGGAGNDEVTILAGDTSILIEVDTNDDALDESSTESMQLVVDAVVSGAVAGAGNDDSETGLIEDNDNVVPAINAPSTINYWTTLPFFSADAANVTFINRIVFQDADASTGIVLVTLNVGNGGGAFEASSGGNVTVSGSGTSLMTITGTIADINAFIAGNNIQFDPPGTSLADRQLTVTIDDNDGGITSRVITLDHSSLSSLDNDSSQSVNLAGWNFNNVDVNMGGGNDTVVTSWSHGPSGSDVHYNGEGGGDTITLVFTPQQLEEILTNSTYRSELDNLLEGDTEDMDLGGTSWNAEVENFEDANLALAAGPTGYAVYGPANSSTGIPGSTSADNGDDFLQGTNGSNTIDGQGGNDIILGLGGNDTLSGGSGSDLILGGTGNDRIDGGAGNDLLSGGAGADVFVAGANPGLDTIVDYSFAEGDVLDLSALIDANFGVVSSDINDFVQLTQSGGDINVFVDVTGTGTFGAGSQVFGLAGIGTASSNDPVKIYLESAEHMMTV